MMDKDKDNSGYDFDNDPGFNANFKKNIDKLFEDSDADQQEQGKIDISGLDDTEEVTSASIDSEVVKDTETEEGQPITQEDIGTTENSQQQEEAVKDQPEETNTDKSLSYLSEESSTQLQESNHDIDEEISGINEALAKQISEEMENDSAKSKKRKKKFSWKVSAIVLTVLIFILCAGLFLGCTKPGNSILLKLGVNISGTIWDSMTHKFGDSTDVTEDVDYLDEDDLNSKAPEVDPSTIVWPDHPGEGRQEEGVYNILLLGEEQIGMGDDRGHTDVMVIATLNTKNKTVKLTSLMRDMLVQIPGYQDNKLNSVFAKGGLDLLYETIALNFAIRLDGCVMVNFDSFEKIVDDLGGLNITLKQNEADYLNSTNYISNRAYRNVVAGTQLMNGNQVLGYARVRKTSTITGQNNDYGRTDRHRIVLNAIYEKCKTKSKADLVSLMFKFLPMITTDIDSKCFQAMLNSYLDSGMNTAKIEQLRIPADGTFKDNLRVRGMSVIIPDLEANVAVLHNFIFGDEAVTGTPEPTATPTGNTSSTVSN